MITIPLPITGAFDAKIIELADRFQVAKPGDSFKLCLYDTGTVTVDAALAFYDIVRSRPKGIGVHIHSHVCLMISDVLLWLAGDTRTLRADAWVHFREYPRHWLERSDIQQFADSLEGRDLPSGRTAFQENYLTVERLVKKELPVHLWNRRVWGSELEEWNITKPASAASKLITPKKPIPKKPAVPSAVKVTGNPSQMVLFS
jgi:hypothetical protein